MFISNILSDITFFIKIESIDRKCTYFINFQSGKAFTNDSSTRITFRTFYQIYRMLAVHC